MTSAGAVSGMNAVCKSHSAIHLTRPINEMYVFLSVCSFVLVVPLWFVIYSKRMSYINQMGGPQYWGVDKLCPITHILASGHRNWFSFHLEHLHSLGQSYCESRLASKNHNSSILWTFKDAKLWFDLFIIWAPHCRSTHMWLWWMKIALESCMLAPISLIYMCTL